MKRFHFLIISDNTEWLHIFQKNLDLRCYAVHSCKNILKAAPLLNRKKFHLVFLDAAMGRQTITALQKHLKMHSPESLLMILDRTSCRNKSVDSFEHGVHDVLIAPFDRPELINKIETALTYQSQLAFQPVTTLSAENQLCFQNGCPLCILDASPVPTFVIDCSHQIIQWNRACESLTGLPKKQVLNRKSVTDFFSSGTNQPLLIDLVLDDDRKSLHRHYNGKFLLKSNLLPDAFEAMEWLTINNKKRYFRLLASRMTNKKGQVIGAMETLQDITTEKHLQQSLEKSENLFQDLVGNAPIGICIVQKDRIAYMNPEQQRLLWNMPTITSLRDLNVHSADRLIFSQFCDRIHMMESGTPPVDIRLHSSSNTDTGTDRITWVTCRTTPIDWGEDRGVLVTMADITRSKELERLVQLREKMASLGHVAAGIAHEIRNPLSGINILLDAVHEILDNDPDNMEEARELVTEAKKAAGKIETVISRVLDFSRPSQPVLKKSCINHAIKEALNLTQSTLKKSGIKLNIALDKKIPDAYIDPQLIEQVMLNLINNSENVMKSLDRERWLHIETLHKAGRIVIKTCDSGPGVPNDLRQKIFDPFFTTRNGGAGIGLSLCQRIIADHGGTIEIDTSHLGGAEFTISIPIEKREVKR